MIHRLAAGRDAARILMVFALAVAGFGFAGPGMATTAIGGAAAGPAEPATDCSPQSIAHYAWRAPFLFERHKKGLLYGVETHTPATRVGSTPGVYSCALVAYAILRKAGCNWVRYTADAKAIYDMALATGWRRAATQEPGCIVAWNSVSQGKRPAIGRQGRSAGVMFRHVGVTAGRWLSVDNTSFLSRPLPFITWRPYRYGAPMFLCPRTETRSSRQGR